MNCLGVDGQLVDGALACLVLWGVGACRGVIAFGVGTGGWVLCHGRDALPTWDSIAYWERGTKGPSSGL